MYVLNIGPLIDENPGIEEAITADTDTPILIPHKAQNVVYWFEDADGNIVKGRVGMSTDGEAIETINSDTLGHFPPMPIQQPLRLTPGNVRVTHLHVTCAVNATFYGSWLS